MWNSQSVLSAWDDLYDLVLVRWDKHIEWSPWNCILLTKEEAAAHAKLHKLEEVSSFCHWRNYTTSVTCWDIAILATLCELRYAMIHVHVQVPILSF